MPTRISWQAGSANPVIHPGQLHGALDAQRAAAGHVLDLGDRYRMYYWGSGREGNVVLMAEAPASSPNEWKPVGDVLLGPQPDTEHNCGGPSFPFVFPVEGPRWHMVFCSWGKPSADGRLHNRTCLAVSDDAGLTWRYHDANPILSLDRKYDQAGTGSASVVRVGDKYRMYYTAIAEWFDCPAGVRTGHGDRIPRISIAYAVSDDGMTWRKPLDQWMVAPRGFDADPYEYINSKPFVLREQNGWRMFISTFGHAYRVRSLVSADGLQWACVASDSDGDLGVGGSGAFDDQQRCYASVLQCREEYRLWYTGNGFGATGIGYMTGKETLSV